MDQQQKTVLTWVLILGGAAVVITKLKGSLFGSSFNPNDPNGLADVWNDTPDNHNSYTYSFHSDVANNIAESIYKEFGAFNTNFSNVFSLFKECKTQGDVFQVCQLFQNNYDANLWNSMINGFGLYPFSGLSHDQLNQINNYVLSLPQ